MIKNMLNEASKESLVFFIQDLMDELKARMPNIYKEELEHLHKTIYGCHFSKWLLEEACSEPHWTLEQTTSVARERGIDFKLFNEYDWNYVMNMIYSDYHGSIPDNIQSYSNVAYAFLVDEDAPKDKAVRYYFAMN